MLGKYKVPAGQKNYIQLGEELDFKYYYRPDLAGNLTADRIANFEFLQNEVVAKRANVALQTHAWDRTGRFAEEIEYLMKAGYTVSGYGWRLIPPLP